MKTTRSAKLLGITLVAGLAVAACGSDSDSDSGTADSGTTDTQGTDAPVSSDGASGDSTPAGSGDAVSLSGDCPDTVVLQTDWMPEAEHGFLYSMIGDDYELDSGKAYVTGPLLDSNGNDTGVKLQIRSGGVAQNFSPVTQILYTDEANLLGFVYTDEAIQFSGDFPTVAIESSFQKNPQIIMWDPETYPDVEGVADLGEKDVKVRYFGGAAYMDFLTGSGLLSESQVDGSYAGDPSLFIADQGKAAQQGFASSEPYLYENELTDWGKPVAYEYINDMGWENYGQSIATRPENIETYSACFEKLVPLIQQSSIDFLADPTHGNDIIVAASDAFGADFGWDYTQGAADFGVEKIKEDDLIANGPDGVVGKFDMDRVSKLIEVAVPIYTAQGATPKDGVTAEDVVTNQFIDDSIGF